MDVSKILERTVESILDHLLPDDSSVTYEYVVSYINSYNSNCTINYEISIWSSFFNFSCYIRTDLLAVDSNYVINCSKHILLPSRLRFCSSSLFVISMWLINIVRDYGKGYLR